MSKNKGTPTEEIMLETAIRSYELEFVRLGHLDDKAMDLISVIGIVIGLVSGFGGFTLRSSDYRIALSGTVLPIVLFFIDVLCFLFALTFGLHACRIRGYVHIYGSTGFSPELESGDRLGTIKNLYDGYLEASSENRETNNKKAKAIKRCHSFLYGGITLLFIFSLSLILIR